MERSGKKSPEDPGGHEWKGPLPKGWTDESRKKFWDSLTGRAPKHKVTQCIKKMQGTDISDPGAFCAALADRVIPGWREEAAKDRRKKKKAQTVFTRDELHEYGRVASEWAAATGETDQLGKVVHALELASFALRLNFDDHGNLIASSLSQPLKSRRDYGKLPPEEDEDNKHSKMPGVDTMSLGDQENDEPNKLASSEWISRSEVEALCPSCAERMKKAGFKRVRASVLRRVIERGPG